MTSVRPDRRVLPSLDRYRHKFRAALNIGYGPHYLRDDLDNRLAGFVQSIEAEHDQQIVAGSFDANNSRGEYHRNRMPLHDWCAIDHFAPSLGGPQVRTAHASFHSVASCRTSATPSQFNNPCNSDRLAIGAAPIPRQRDQRGGTSNQRHPLTHGRHLPLSPAVAPVRATDHGRRTSGAEYATRFSAPAFPREGGAVQCC